MPQSSYVHHSAYYCACFINHVNSSKLNPGTMTCTATQQLYIYTYTCICTRVRHPAVGAVREPLPNHKLAEA